jgi:hypothetical protein
MSNYLYLSSYLQHITQATGVINMAVTEHYEVNFRKVNSQQLGIVYSREAKSGIYKDFCFIYLY